MESKRAEYMAALYRLDSHSSIPRWQLLGIPKHGRDLAWADPYEFIHQYGPLIPNEVVLGLFLEAGRWSVGCYLQHPAITEDVLTCRLEHETKKVVRAMIMKELERREELFLADQEEEEEADDDE